MNETIPHILRPAEGETTEIALHRRARTLHLKLKSEFGKDFEISAEHMKGIEDGKWAHEIKVRDGMHVGASVDMTWQKKKENQLMLEVDQSTKIGNYIMMGTMIPCFMIGGIMGIFGVAPLDFLPGTKLGGLLGALIALIPGVILFLIMRSILMRNHKEENRALKAKVHALVKENFVDGILQFSQPDPHSTAYKN